MIGGHGEVGSRFNQRVAGSITCRSVIGQNTELQTGDTVPVCPNLSQSVPVCPGHSKRPSGRVKVWVRLSKTKTQSSVIRREQRRQREKPKVAIRRRYQNEGRWFCCERISVVALRTSGTADLPLWEVVVTEV